MSSSTSAVGPEKRTVVHLFLMGIRITLDGEEPMGRLYTLGDNLLLKKRLAEYHKARNVHLRRFVNSSIRAIETSYCRLNCYAFWVTLTALFNRSLWTRRMR